MSEPKKFRDLAIGEVFIFEVPRTDYKGPFVKTSTRLYRHAHIADTKFHVGTIDVAVRVETRSEK